MKYYSNLYQDIKNPNSYGSIQGLLQNAKQILLSIKRDDVVNFFKMSRGIYSTQGYK